MSLLAHAKCFGRYMIVDWSCPCFRRACHRSRTTSKTIPMLATFVVSVFVLGFAVRPLLLAPLSELCGQTIVYHVCNAGFTVFTIACAVASNMDMLVALRFLAGFAGVAIVTCGRGSIANMMPREERGRAMAVWSMGALHGQITGPVARGFLFDAKGWRWAFWVVAIYVSKQCSHSPIRSLIHFAGCRHRSSSTLVQQGSYSPTVLERKAQRLRTSIDNKEWQSKHDAGESHRQLLLKAVARSVKMLFFSPIVGLNNIYVGVTYV